MVIARAGKPVVRLVAVDARAPRRSGYGAWRRQVCIADDVDESPDDIAGAFGA